jgi:hypothetical protein
MKDVSGQCNSTLLVSREEMANAVGAAYIHYQAFLEDLDFNEAKLNFIRFRDY